MPSVLEVKEGLQEQSSGETIIYTLDANATGWTATPVIVGVIVIDEDDGADVTSTVMPSGSHSVSGSVITLKPLTALTVDKTYQIKVKFTGGGNTFEPYGRVRCPY